MSTENENEQNEDDITQIRDDIDRVDAEILKLLAERKAFSLQMAREKGLHARPSRDMSREEDLISDRINSGMSHDLDSGLVNRVWREIINDSVRVQQEFLGRTEATPDSIVVAIQGIDGSYSHLASQQFFDAKGITPSYVRSSTFADAIRAVQEGTADVAVLPVENTTSGAISEVYDVLLDSQLHFVGDVRFRVRHCLLGVAGASIEGLRRIYCHPQAVTQCSEFLAGLDHVELVYFSDTALSGKRIGEMNDPTVAAIASEEAARLYGLDILKTGVANQEENYTRFVVVAGQPAEVPEGVQSKTSIVMAVGNHPGALMDALAVFREADINLVMLESRPIPHNPREELFYLDFDGNISDPAVQAVFDALTKQLRFLRILGSYPSRDLRPRPIERDVARGEPKGLSALAEVPPTTAAPKGYKLGSRVHKPQNTVVEVAGVKVGGGEMIMIAGPCAVESWDQVMAAAKAVKEAGGSILRGGCFKPRSSPYSFQGLGYEALEMLVEAGKAYGLPVVTEVLSPDDVDGCRQEGRHPPDRGPEHAELLAAQRRGPCPSPGSAQERDELVHRGAAPGGRVHPGRWQPTGHALRAGNPHLRDCNPQHPRSECGAGAPSSHPSPDHRRSVTCRRRSGPGCAAGPRRPGDRGGRDHGGDPPPSRGRAQ